MSLASKRRWEQVNLAKRMHDGLPRECVSYKDALRWLSAHPVSAVPLRRLAAMVWSIRIGNDCS